MTSINQPKKRGRPTNEELAARGVMSAAAELKRDIETMPFEAPGLDALHEAAQAYAMRVWAGQADDLGRGDRIARVVRALEAQGLPTGGIKYPGEQDGDDWTEEDEAPVVWRTQRDST